MLITDTCKLKDQFVFDQKEALNDTVTEVTVTQKGNLNNGLEEN